MILHVDMDAFFASVEQLDDPALRGKPVAVGGQSDRGVVMAASYEARRFGIRSAMPAFQARRKCPQAVFVPPRRERYKAVSREVMEILRQFSPLVEQVSIDEAYLDIAGLQRLYGNPRNLALQIKTAIREGTGLTCSIGIAPNRFLAKVASDMEKPDGLFILTPADLPAFVERLPIEKVPGVGAKTLAVVHSLGIRTLGQVRRYPAKTLEERLGKFGARLLHLSHGRDDTPVTPHRPHKSVSAEETLASNTDDPEILRAHLMSQSEEVGRELRKQGVRARTVTLKVKHADFRIVTRSSTLPLPTQSSEVICREALRLLAGYPLGRPVRLVGVGASGLVPAATPVQADLFEHQDRNWETVDRTLDEIARKFGRPMVRKAAGPLREKD